MVQTLANQRDEPLFALEQHSLAIGAEDTARGFEPQVRSLYGELYPLVCELVQEANCRIDLRGGSVGGRFSSHRASP